MGEPEQNEPSREEMIAFLRNHFRYFTMSSWNRSNSYARNVKIYRLGLTHDQESKAYDLLEAQGAFDSINEIINGFNERYGYQYQMGFNGRSNGYIVLYQGGKKPSGYQSHCTECGQLSFKKVLPTETAQSNICGKCGAPARVNFEETHMQIYTLPGKGMDESDCYDIWSEEQLKSIYELVRDFDMAVDDCIKAFKDMIDNYSVVEKDIPCTRKIKVLEPIPWRDGHRRNGDGNMISWRYNKFGDVELWNGRLPQDEHREADLYMQGDFDVRAFFNQQGLDVDDIESGDTGECEDPGYF